MTNNAYQSYFDECSVMKKIVRRSLKLLRKHGADSMRFSFETRGTGSENMIEDI